MKAKKLSWGELVIPGAAVVYSIYAILEQIIAELETKTVIYSVCLSLPIFICAGIAVYLVLRSKEEIETSDEARQTAAKARNNMLLFLLWAVLFVVSISALGYFIAIFVYLGVFLYAMGERPWYKAAVLAAVASVAIHFMFVKWIGMPLPKGLLSGIL